MSRDRFSRTRRSLIGRLDNWKDQRSWQDFFNTYHRLIYSVARKAGLTDAEAQDVVQETVLTVARRIDGLRYDPAIGSFKGWLLNITRWRIADQFRKRRPGEGQSTAAPDDSRRTATIDRIPSGTDPGAVWDTEWQRNLFDAALERVKRKVDPKQYQIFHCYAIKEWPPHKVAEQLGVSVGQVYLARHRVGAMIKKEVRSLERKGG